MLDEIAACKGFLICRSIELDLRRVIKERISPEFDRRIDFIPDESVKEEAFSMLKDRNPLAELNDENINYDIVDYLSILQEVNVIRSNPKLIPKTYLDHFRKFINVYQQIIPFSRNNITHSRFITNDELDDFYRSIREIIEDCPELFQATSVKASNIYLSKPEALKKEKDLDPKLLRRLNSGLLFSDNMPEADYLHIGFTGRKTELKQILDELNLGREALLIYGEGGVGKTALVREVCESFIETDPKINFIWWHSSKQRSFINRKIHAHVPENNSLADIEKRVTDTGWTFKDLKEDPEINALFVLDNMETEDEKEVTKIANKLSLIGQVIITSRRDMQDVSARPIELGGLKKEDSKSYLYKLAKFFSCQRIVQAGEDVYKWAEQLNHNPLRLRTFVEVVREGIEPEDYLNRPEGRAKEDDYMYKDAGDYLSEKDYYILAILELTFDSLPASLISRLVDHWEKNTVIEVLSKLSRTPFIQREVESSTALFSLSASSKAYISRQEKFSNAKREMESYKITEQLRHIKTFQSTEVDASLSNYMDFECLNLDKAFLGNEKREIYLKNQENPERLMQELKNLDSEYQHENFAPLHLHLGVLHMKQGDTYEAEEYLQNAISNSDTPLNKDKAFFQYAKFCQKINHESEAISAIQQIETKSSRLEAIIFHSQLLSDKRKGIEMIRNFSTDTSLPSDMQEIIKADLKLSTKLVLQNLKNEEGADALNAANNFLDHYSIKFNALNFNDETISVFFKEFFPLYIKAIKKMRERMDIEMDSLRKFIEDGNYSLHHNEFKLLKEFVLIESNELNIEIQNILKINDNYELYEEMVLSKQGKITSIKDDWGYIKSFMGVTLWFHKNSVRGGDRAFSLLKKGDEVTWESQEEPKNGQFLVALRVKKIS